MRINIKKGFTVIEILVCLAILTGIIGVVITMMSRGASNVQKGSFNALAANQAFWIVSVMRNDIVRSISAPQISASDNSVWNGDTEFKVNIQGGTASYSIKKQGSKKTFVRSFVPSANSSLSNLERKTQSFGDEYLSDMKVFINDDKSYSIKITMKDSKKTSGNNEIIWTSTIYPPKPKVMDEFWCATME